MIALLTDFGLDDIYVGVMKSVMLSIDPAAQIVDISHAIPSREIETGAFLLAVAWPYLPSGAIAVAVVDPGVGSSRRAIALGIHGRLFVGPDNGLISLVAADQRAAEAVDLDRRRFHLANRVGDTFHGRDIFAPVAAHLHAGAALMEVGTPIDPGSLVRIRTSSAAFGQREIVASVKLIDRFGNAILDLSSAGFQVWIGGARTVELSVQTGWQGTATIEASYAAASDAVPALIANSFGRIEIALRNSSAANFLGEINCGAKVTIRRSTR